MKRLIGLLLVSLLLNGAAFAQNKYVGEVFMTAGTYCPRDTVVAAGQTLAIAQYQVLYSVIGNTYAGDGRVSFRLPDLQGRTPIGLGHGTALSFRKQGEKGGVESMPLNQNHLPSHTHPLYATSKRAKSADPAGKMLALSGTYANGAPDRQLALNSVGRNQAGPSESVPVMQPFQVMRYCVVVNGDYPPRS